MSKELICPVAEVVSPVLTKVTTLGGQKSNFPTPENLGVKIALSPIFLSSETTVDITEARSKATISLHLNTLPYNTNPDLVRATYRPSKRRSELTVVGSLGVVALSAAKIQSLGYGVEGLERLYRIEGDTYQFLVGQKPDCAFVDGWLREAQSPSWRVALALQDDRKILIPNSRLLIFEKRG